MTEVEKLMTLKIIGPASLGGKRCGSSKNVHWVLDGRQSGRHRHWCMGVDGVVFPVFIGNINNSCEEWGLGDLKTQNTWNSHLWPWEAALLRESYGSAMQPRETSGWV